MIMQSDSFMRSPSVSIRMNFIPIGQHNEQAIISLQGMADESLIQINSYIVLFFQILHDLPYYCKLSLQYKKIILDIGNGHLY